MKKTLTPLTLALTFLLVMPFLTLSPVYAKDNGNQSNGNSFGHFLNAFGHEGWPGQGNNWFATSSQGNIQNFFGKGKHNGQNNSSSTATSTKPKEKDDNDNDKNDHGGRIFPASTTSTPPILPPGRTNNIQALIDQLNAMIARLEARLQALLGLAGQSNLTITNVNATNIASTNATVNWTTNLTATSKVYYSTVSPIDPVTAPIVSDNGFLLSHSLNLSGLNPATTYFFIVTSMTAMNKTATSSQMSFSTLSTQAPNPPVISSLTVTPITTSTAQLNWATDQAADSRVWFSTTSPVTSSGTPNFLNASLVTSHTALLSSLNASTTYFYVVGSMNTSSSLTISAQSSFTTPALPDTTPPAISAVSAINVSSTTAQIQWQTNEPATSQVFFSQVSPVNLSTATSTPLDTTLVTSHLVNIGSLPASTTIFYVTASKDAVNNLATSTEQSFTTTP